MMDSIVSTYNIDNFGSGMELVLYNASLFDGFVYLERSDKKYE